MIPPKHKWIIWAALNAACFLGAAVSFIEFYAAVDLGYDRYPGGKAIIDGWSYALLSLLVCGVGLAVLARRSWRSSWRSTIGAAKDCGAGESL